VAGLARQVGYLLIAGTYTPFLAQMKSVVASAGLGVGVWLSAAIGMALSGRIKCERLEMGTTIADQISAVELTEPA
jgi:predicted membrane channel-forming protein YqfA (hemolysin III family)